LLIAFAMTTCVFRARAAVAVLLPVFVLPVVSPAVAQTMRPSDPALPQSQASSTRAAGARDSQPFGISVITAEEISRSGATTVNDAIIRLLGVAAHQDYFGGGEYTLDVRGFGKTADSNQVVVVDGIRIKEADYDGVRLAGIPIDSVWKIEVVRGSGAVLYGAGATGGVIVVTTKAYAGVARGNMASVYAAAGSHGLVEGRADATLASGGFSLDVNALDRRTENHRDNARSVNDSVAATAQWRGESLRLGASRSQDSLAAGQPGFLTPAQYQANPRFATTPADSVTIDNVRNGLFAEMRLGNWQLFADIGQRDKKLRTLSQGKYAGGYDVKASTQALRAVHGTRQASFSNSLVLGTDYARWRRDTPAPGAAGLVATQVSRAAYVRDELTLAATGTTISAGVRSERVTSHNDNAVFGSSDLSDPLHSWELGINQPLNPELSVYGRVGRSFRAANVEEFNYTPVGVVLVPQRSRDIELGSRYNTGPLTLDARLYRSALTNEIGYDLARFTSVSVYGANVNFDPTRRTGLELDASYAYSDTLALRVNAARRSSVFVSGPYAGKSLVRAPNSIFAVHADWTPAPGHLLSGGVTAVSSQRLDTANLCAMPGYHVSDLRYAYQWKSAELSLSVANLLDRKFFNKAECDAGITGAIYPEPGRAATLALRVRF
jgi:iron complex outermembrane receptor protein